MLLRTAATEVRLDQLDTHVKGGTSMLKGYRKTGTQAGCTQAFCMDV
jgi:hypothetical protein